MKLNRWEKDGTFAKFTCFKANTLQPNGDKTAAMELFQCMQVNVQLTSHLEENFQDFDRRY